MFVSIVIALWIKMNKIMFFIHFLKWKQQILARKYWKQKCKKIEGGSIGNILMYHFKAVNAESCKVWIFEEKNGKNCYL